MKIFNKVAIVGVGLVGGSLALAIKRKKMANIVVGVSRHKNSLIEAARKHAIDYGSQSLSIIKGADLVILATPVNTIMDLAPQLAKIISKECIVIDVGSTKGEIVARLVKLFPNYLGTHPLAGSERRGIRNADEDLFKGSLCILTPDESTSKEILSKVRKLWIGVGAKTVNVAPVTHDKILAFVSHLPHALSFTLMNSVPEVFLPFASSGLKDTTRISASEPELWADIFLSNQKFILRALGLFEDNLKQIKLAIKNRNRKLLLKILQNGQEKRETIG